MRVAVSNLAWPEGDDTAATDLLVGAGIVGVEVAPTRYWAHPARTTTDEAVALRRRWERRGLAICALQSLLFSRQDLRLFDDQVRGDLLQHLEAMARLAHDLEAGIMVLGSPRQRRRGDIPLDVATDWARRFLTDVADAIAPLGVTLVLEANPPEYGCDFVTDTEAAVELVDSVARSAVRAHLDVGCTQVAGGDAVGDVLRHGASFAHVHASARDLAPLRTDDAETHIAVAEGLRRHGYGGWVSVEVLAAGKRPLEDMASSARLAVEWYG